MGKLISNNIQITIQKIRQKMKNSSEVRERNPDSESIPAKVAGVEARGGCGGTPGSATFDTRNIRSGG